MTLQEYNSLYLEGCSTFDEAINKKAQRYKDKKRKLLLKKGCQNIEEELVDCISKYVNIYLPAIYKRGITMKVDK